MSGASWSNTGLLKASNGGTLDLGGTFTLAGLGTFDGTGGTIRITGTLDNSGATLALSGTTGSLTLASGGTIKGGTVAASGGAELVPAGGTLDGVRLNADVTIGNNQSLTVKNGLELNGTLTLAVGSSGSDMASLNFNGTQTLLGTGQIIFGGSTGGYYYGYGDRIRVQGGGTLATAATLTIGPDITIHGTQNGGLAGSSSYDSIINQGTIQADTPSNTVVVQGFSVINQGTLVALSGATLDWNGSAAFDGADRLHSQLAGMIKISGSLLGNTLNAGQYAPQGTTRFDGSGTAISPQLLEVMSRDEGAVASGFNRNFAYGTLALDNDTYVRFVDQSDNAPGTEPEALYTNSLLVPAGTTLDLNGLQLYTRAAQIAGTVIGGTVTQIPDSGLVSLGTPTSGTISTPGELDEWTFFGRSGHSVGVVFGTGSDGSPAPVSPYLGYAEVRLLDASGNVLTSASNNSNGQTVSLDDVPLPADGNYRVQVHAPSGHTEATGNYMLSVWDVTADVAPLVFSQQVGGKIENPYSVDRWTFSASANQQVKFDLINTTGAGTVFDLAGPEGWTGFSDISGDSDLITLPSSGTYTVTAHGTGGQYGGNYTFKLVPTVQSDLSLGTAYNGTLTGSGHAELFRVNVPTGMPMLIGLDDSSSAGHNELYLGFGSPPSRGVYDSCAKGPGTDQQILVPMATTGTWYVLVYGESVPSASSYSLLATTSGLVLTEVTPDHHGNTAPMVLTLSGAGFDNTTCVELVAGDSSHYAASGVDVDSFTQITATLAAGIPAGTYSILVSQPDGDNAQLSDAYQVTAGGVPQLETNLVVPAVMGYHMVAALYVEYSNTGNVAMPAPLLVLASGDPEGNEHPFLTLDSERLVEGFYTSAIPEGFSNSIQILAAGQTPGLLQPGESFTVPVYYAGMQTPWDFSDGQFEFNLGVLAADNSTTVNWAELKDDMRPAAISTAAWDAIWPNFTAQAGDTWGDYVRMLDDNAAYLGRLGQRVVDIGDLLAFEFQQADGLGPMRTLASAVDAAVEAPGLPILFSRVFSGPISQRYELGTLGYGWSHNWDYLLTNANDGTVTVHGPAGSQRIFQPDSRHTGTYFSQSGDYGTLTAAGGGTFDLREADGLLYRFDSKGLLSYVEDTNENRITATYSGGQLTSLSHSSGQSLTIAYSAAGRVECITDPDNRQTVLHYDASNEHLTSVDYFDGQTVGYTYSTDTQEKAHLHALTETAYPGSVTGTFTHQYFTYDAQGRLSSTYRDANAERVDFSYDSAGKVTATNAVGDTSESYFDHRGLLVKTVDGLGNAVSLAYDNAYNLTAITDPSGHSTTYAYDANGNLTRSTDASRNLTRFTYTGTYNRLASVIDANENRTRYAYDGDGNLTSIACADSSRESWAYDSLGQPTAWTNRRGNATPGDPNDHVVANDYDSDGLLLSKTYADGSHVDFTYDARGNLLTATDATGTTTFTYDPATDRLMRIDYPAGEWLEFTYNAAGQRESSLDQTGHRLTYHYDGIGRLDFIENESSVREVDYDYDAAGRLALKTLGNGVYTTYEYDDAGQLLHLVNYQPDGSVLSRFDYTYDSRGRRTQMATSYGAWTYEYDDIGQLTHAVLASTDPDIPDQDLTYVYDAVGNRIRTIINGVTTEYTTNNMNQYVTVGGVTYAYDRDGNLTQQGDTTYTYNDENRLIGVNDGTDLWQYTYDALGNRVAATENGTTTRYVIDPIGLGNVVGEYDASGGLIAHYDHGFGLISRTDGLANAAYYTFDAIGNTSEMSATAGAVTNRYAYDPFGVSLRVSETVPNAFKYVGEFGVMKERNGLIFMRARYFSSESNAFLSPDPIGIAEERNAYAYVANTPTCFNDPSGLKVKELEEFKNAYEERWQGSPEEILEKHLDPRRRERLEKATGRLAGRLLEDLLRELLFGWIPGVGTIDSLLTIDDYADNLRDVARQTDENHGSNYRPSALPNAPAQSQSSGGSDVAHASDPNQKTGPAGFGDAGFMTGQGALAYRIDFENEAAATAPAQVVNVTDQLDSNLDWTTFRLTEIGFGDQLLAVPDNTQHFETTAPMTYNGVDFEVQIEAGIRSDTGEVYANFYSIDPNTSLPPSVLVGFLPPEDGTGRGMGHFSYTVDAKSGLADGTEIRNVALIQFDRGEIIATNQVDPHDPSQGTDPAKECLNTITTDVTAPRVTTITPGPDTTVRSPSTIVVTFDEDLAAGTVDDGTFKISTAQGPDGQWCTGDDTWVSGTVTYDPATDQATFTPATPLEPGDYGVWLDSARIADVVGNRLDGEYPGTDPGLPSGDGTPGGDFVATFRSNAALKTLALGVPRAGTLDGDSDLDLYRVNVIAGQRLTVELDGYGPQDENEVYVRYGAVPDPGTPSGYDAAGKVPGHCDQIAALSLTRSGVCYVLVRSTSDASPADGYTILAHTGLRGRIADRVTRWSELPDRQPAGLFEPLRALFTEPRPWLGAAARFRPSPSAVLLAARTAGLRDLFLPGQNPSGPTRFEWLAPMSGWWWERSAGGAGDLLLWGQSGFGAGAGFDLTPQSILLLFYGGM